MHKIKNIIIIAFAITIGFVWGYMFNNQQTKKQKISATNKIETEERLCLDKSNNAAEIRNCIYKSKTAWDYEITSLMDSLKNITTNEEYKLIEDSQKNWKMQQEKDEILIEKFIFHHGGTMYFDIAAAESATISKTRAQFLEEIYSTLTNN